MSGLTMILLGAVVLAIIGSAFVSLCDAETTTTGARCTRFKWGPFQRCWQHEADLWVPGDFLALALWVASAVVGIVWATYGGFPVLAHDLGRALGWVADRIAQGMPA